MSQTDLNNTASEIQDPPDTDKATVQEENPYAYLDRDFSSENFKIEIKNLPKFYGIGEFKKLLNEKLKLNANKIKTPRRNCQYAFVCFRNEEDRDNAIKVISEYTWKGKQLAAVYAKPCADPLVKKRQQFDSSTDSNKKQKIPIEDRIKQSTVPLVDLEYEKQLETKQDGIKTTLRKLGNELSHQNIELRKYIEQQKEKYDGLPCELLGIKYSDQINGYRNKCEFSVGINPKTKLATVGFRIGAYVDGITGVGPVEHLAHIPDSMKIAVKVFEDFVRSSSLEVYNAEHQTGHFRQLTVRSAIDQLMVVVGIHPQNLEPANIETLKEQLIEFFSIGPGKDAKVTSLYYEEIVKKHSGDDFTPATFLWGETHIYETILGLKFRVSPQAFFQVNTKAAEILYQSAIDLVEPTENSSMLDVCCGTGTIGLCFSKHCSQVLGLEIVPQAIVDAKENALMNKVENSEFFVGKAEEILGSVCYKTKNEDVFAVVDPPRAGLHQKAIHQVRKIKKINRLLYISCNPKLAMKNFIDLGRPESKYLTGQFFVPVKAVAVDLFPHTHHCELMILFKRWDLVEQELNK
ncbi:tRNA (uracil-5-)-methyltransferase homolog A [Anthonomus grandis grandis]|uniref:tRNA (uracil-5-)-methyltransferase homolog A n=1 Tax=Anthonomus grandis grandis TaxID=2921223 RepID=UPI00216597D5|nr:tRNA (uracil-5-)-methyltransferase homolog A [Anthonomus grandis grandis]